MKDKFLENSKFMKNEFQENSKKIMKNEIQKILNRLESKIFFRSSRIFYLQ